MEPDSRSLRVGARLGICDNLPSFTIQMSDIFSYQLCDGMSNPGLLKPAIGVRSQAGVCSEGLAVRQPVCEAGLEGGGNTFVMFFFFSRRERFPVIRLRRQEEEKSGRRGVSLACQPFWHVGTLCIGCMHTHLYISTYAGTSCW